MIDRKELKRRAKFQLGGRIFADKWLTALLVLLIFDAIVAVLSGSNIIGTVTSMGTMIEGFQSGEFTPTTFSFNAVGGIGSIAILILSGPFNYGISKMFLKQTRDGEKMNIADIFLGFKDDVGTNILLSVLIGIFTFLWALLFVIPGIIKGLSYSMSYYIKADHPEYDWKACINESKRLMNGHKGELFVLKLSFIGWYIVGAFCLGVGTLWVNAYASAAEAQFYQSIAYPVSAFPADQFEAEAFTDQL